MLSVSAYIMQVGMEVCLSVCRVSRSVAQASLKCMAVLAILLSQPQECWNYRRARNGRMKRYRSGGREII